MRNRTRKIRMIAAAALAAVLCAGLVHAQDSMPVPETEQIEEIMQAPETAQLPEAPAEPVPVQEYSPAEPTPMQEPVQPEIPALEPVIPAQEAAPMQEAAPISEIVSIEEPVQEELPMQETEIPNMDTAAPPKEANAPSEAATPAMASIEESVQEAAPVQEAGQAAAPAQAAELPSDSSQNGQNEIQDPVSEKTNEPAQEAASAQDTAPVQEQPENETPETPAQQPQDPEPSEEPMWLDLMPVEFRIEETKNAQAWSVCLVPVEITNITNQSLEKLEIRITSKDAGYIITPYETEEEAWEGIATYGICEDGEQKNTEKTLRISSLPTGAKIKADLVIYAMEDTCFAPEETQIQVSCSFSAGSTRYQNAGAQKIALIKDASKQPAGDDPVEDPTDDPAEEPTTAAPAEDPAEEPANDNPAEEPATTAPAEEPVEEPAAAATVEEPAEEPANEEPTEEPLTEASATEEPTTEAPAVEEPTTEAPAAEEPTTDPADDEMITVEVIDDGEEEETEDVYYDDWGYYDDWVVYGDYSGTQINTATPYVLVQSYSHKRTIHTGDAFGMEINFLNTSQKVAMENVVIKVEPSDSLSLASGTNTLFVSGIEAGGTISQQINLLAASECKEATQKIDLTVSFEYIDHNERKTGEASESITIPIAQKDRLELRDPSYDEMQAGREGVISLSYVNKGYTSLYNMEASLELENADAVEKTVYAGNVESGKTGTLDFLVTPQTDGEYTGTVTLTYEDAAQNPVSVVVPLEFYSSMAYVEDDFFFDEEELDNVETEEAGFPLIPVLAAAGAAVIVALITVIAVRRKKKAVSPEADLPEDWFKDEPKK